MTVNFSASGIKHRLPVDVTSYGFEKPPKSRRLKRLIDFALAVALIGLTAPLMALIALIVKLDGGPAVYAHRRIGSDGRSFRCWKFRSMVMNADQAFQQLLAQDDRA